MARACLAFGIYVAFLTLGVGAETGKGYWTVIAAGTRPFLEWSQHFRGLPEVAQEIPANQHSHLVLILALFLVSWQLPIKRRVACFGVLATLAVLQDWVTAGLSLRLHEAKGLFDQRGWLMLLPWEYDTIEAVWYLVYAIPLQAAPFLLFLLTALWNAGVKPAEFFRGMRSPAKVDAPNPETSPGSRSLLRPGIVWTLAALFLAAGGGVGAGVWARVREHDPLHLRTHLFLGNLHLQEGKLPEAEAEYRHVVQADTAEGEAWLRLAQVQFRLGDRGEAVAILEQAARVVRDPAWMDRIRAGLKDLGSPDPYVTHARGTAHHAEQP